MRKATIIKITYQIIIGAALSFLYMQIRPYEGYTLSWPFAFLGAWFLLVGWFNYLKYDRLSIFTVTEKNKKDREAAATKTKFHNKTFFDYVNTPLQPDTAFTDKEKSIIKMRSNFITSAIFFLLACFF